METQTCSVSSCSSNFAIHMLFVCVIIIFSSSMVASANFLKDIDHTWGGGDRVQILNNGEGIAIALDETSCSGFQSRNQYLFAKIDLQIKLVPGNSAGTVTAFYVSSKEEFHDEIDFEFLGRVEGDPYILQTNMFIHGVGKRETQFFLWFDPTTDFHNYTILWTPFHIVLSVDGIPIRELKNNKEKGAPFPMRQPMRIYGSLWNADSWATRGGAVKIDWTKGPFRAWFKNLRVDGCLWSDGNSNCTKSSTSWLSSTLDNESQQHMKWAHTNYMFYDYCTDTKRFPKGLPLEC
ncbi:probable xyloglucan endotransglucosylase/hydrolase protein 23 [Benincasa hispida]|uniref:probable xyloglucan endotransglucosylase/hydrolase protein 23 n=1 Tax=Benincasa hispida TaxID=102211 RepID=UPI00190069A5|nr:probable xyloglucan endotransglucosylase/hydrolase protein 23 [Benincasa hispida]